MLMFTHTTMMIKMIPIDETTLESIRKLIMLIVIIFYLFRSDGEII